ncbi:MAG TPA: CheR family methyltransferase [Chitinophagaceae bacterium]|nr:CheR family methyltransferase [Chitinophagaceae bacterium]
MSNQKNITDEELLDILQLLLHQYGYDFLNYSPASLKRRILHFMNAMHINSTYDLKYNLINRNDFFTQFLQTVTINTTDMFRDPPFYKTVREKILPQLATYPIIKIWHAGCATGEEVFSLSILLHEEKLLNRCLIYATDLNNDNLERAGKGIVSLNNMKEYIRNYHEAGGKNDFSLYYTARYDYVMIDKALRKNIIFSHHNLVTDNVFNEFQLIFCRNVLIYFNPVLQNKVINLLYSSLVPSGYLALGTKESLLFTDLNSKFDSVYPALKIFKRR